MQKSEQQKQVELETLKRQDKIYKYQMEYEPPVKTTTSQKKSFAQQSSVKSSPNPLAISNQANESEIDNILSMLQSKKQQSQEQTEKELAAVSKPLVTSQL